MSDVEYAYRFAILGTPKAKARARGGKYGHYTPEATRAAEGNVADAFVRARELDKQIPIQHDGPVRLVVCATFIVPKSWPAWKRRAALNGDLKHESKPDSDNITKLVKDALNGLAWVDDSSVYDERTVKRYGEVSATEVYIELRKRAEKL